MEIDIKLINRVHNFLRNHPTKYKPKTVIFNDSIKVISLIADQGKILTSFPYEPE